jgi:peroxiredoxin
VRRGLTRITEGERVPDDVPRVRVLDAAGADVEVGSFWERGPCLLVLLRHFGCVGCAVQVRALAPHLVDLSRAGIRTVLVGNGSARELAQFVARSALEGAPAVLVADPSLRLYRALGLVRSVWATVGPRALLEVARAMAAGHPLRATEGDLTQQGGVLLVDGAGVVRLFHRSRFVGDDPRPSDLVEAALRLAIEERAPAPTTV